MSILVASTELGVSIAALVLIVSSLVGAAYRIVVSISDNNRNGSCLSEIADKHSQLQNRILAAKATLAANDQCTITHPKAKLRPLDELDDFISRTKST